MRYSLTIPDDLNTEIIERATADGLYRAEWIRQALISAIDRDEHFGQPFLCGGMHVKVPIDMRDPRPSL